MATSEIRILINAIYKAAGIIAAKSDLEKFLKEFAKAGAILAAFSIAVKKAYDFWKEGAQIERLREAGTRLAQSYGADMEESVLRIKAASHGAITANAAVSESNRAMLLNVARDSETIAKLVEIAAIRGRVSGLSAQEAFDRITLGIGRLSTRILDDIGIVVDGETAYANYGEAIGKTADQLTEAEKRIALTNAIIEDGNKLLEQTGGIVDDNAQAFERFKTHITDTKNEFEKFLAGPIAEFISGVDAWVFGMGQIESATLRQARALALSNTPQEDYLDEMVRMVEQANLFAQAASLPISYDIDKDGQLIKTERGISTIIDKNYILLEQERAIAQTEEQVAQVRADHTRALEEQRLAQEALIKTQ